MKTEMKKLYVYAYVNDYQAPSIRLTSEEGMASMCYNDVVSAIITTIDVAVPVIEESEVLAVLSGKKLESLISQRNEVSQNLMRIDDEIAKLKAIGHNPAEEASK
jgi:hypothetical protein